MNTRLDLVRKAWVVVINATLALVLYFLIYDKHPIHVGIVVTLILGIALELLGMIRLAEWVNVGVYVFIGGWWVVAYLLAAGNFFGLVGEEEVVPLIIWFSLPAFVVAGIDVLLYERRLRSSRREGPVPSLAG